MPYIDAIAIEKTTASETYSKAPGKMIELPAGLKKNRLKFKLPSNDTFTQAETNVYVEVIDKGFFEYSKSFILSIMSMMHLKFLKTTYKGKTIYINMNSLSNRLGIKINKICSKNFHLEIEKQLETACETEKKIDAFFQEIIKTKYTEDGNELKTASGGLISKTYFRKLLGITAFSQFHSKKKQEVIYLLKDESILFLKKKEDEEWPLLTLFTKNILSKGSFGKVLIVQELSMGRLSVAKIAHDPDAMSSAIISSDSHEVIMNEAIILNKIFLNSNPIGIQQEPYSLFDFRLKNTNYYGYIALKYDSSLDKIMRKLKPDEKIASARQLLKGLQELEKQQISHGDIKEANCLFQRKSDASIECVIADFGGAIDLSKKAKWPSIGTPYYQLEEDYIAYRSLRRQLRRSKKTDSENNKLRTDIKNLLLCRDVYAMGIVLDNLLGSYIKKEESTELYSLISQMLKISWEKRISASEALAKFERAFSLSNLSKAI
ncbi:protein kinase family protein [Candidatus Rhabdochlamydia porcellionis]|uniref:Protein kinase domain n=1 Tax=Candidatus Rhabdochlamydia porcellionis TaxID=225148 RepID=A0ABX8YZ60_9BACT|nr:protein kinase family protein [Candidatus Rhabdochlamydia porcellionis]QZA58635.1 Protein kinase domain [Candidatus Rhabdochlamydia porcellionis]